MKGYEYQSDFAKKYYGQGRDDGRSEEAARALLTVLRARGIAVHDAARERILAQKEPELLARAGMSIADAGLLVVGEPHGVRETPRRVASGGAWTSTWPCPSGRSTSRWATKR